jgi:uncharacterized phage-like protein YoqJ
MTGDIYEQAAPGKAWVIFNGQCGSGEAARVYAHELKKCL